MSKQLNRISMKQYSHDYTKPNEAEKLLYRATRLMANECYEAAVERINEARQLLQEYLAQDNMVEDDDVAVGWVKAHEVEELINGKVDEDLWEKLLPADLKAIALSAWLFFSERGFACDLIHEEDATHVELRIVYEDSRNLPRCPILEEAPFSCEITHVGYCDMVCRYYLPDLFG